MDKIELKLCDIQGRLFVKSAEKEYSSDKFIKSYMNSAVAKGLDSRYNRLQWAGEEYILEEIEDEVTLQRDGEIWQADILFWIGYIYRYWHFYTGENSKQIYGMASAKTMRKNYMMFHTMDPKMAVDDLKEIYYQKHPGYSRGKTAPTPK